MATNLSPPPPPPPPPPRTAPNPSNPNLFAAVDMGTNSFKMVVVRADPTSGKFLALDRLKEPVLLGQSMPVTTTTTTTTTKPSISTQSQLRAITALHKFTQFLQSQNITRYRIVATSAVREAANQRDFLCRVREELGLDVDVLSGEEEAKYVYLGVLQFLPFYERMVLSIDIGGGSTEFVVGKSGEVVFATSVRLGHVNLTEGFVNNGEICRMREHIRSVIRESGLIEKVMMSGFDIVVGSSGTIRAIEKAGFHGYARSLDDDGVLFGEVRRDWRFSRGELRSVVERLCGEDEKIRRERFFKRRSEFIVAGAVLLEEIFGMLDIEEMEVSGYALGEGIIAERLARVCEDYDLNANARWRSVVRLATRFNNKKRMKCAAQCAGIAKEIFEGVRKCNELADNPNKLAVSLDDKDLEYLEAACLLHNIGLFTGKKGYHKQSYHIIMNGDHLHGYGAEEVKLIALLARHHRKKFPKFDHGSLQGFPKEAKKKFRILCAIIRISVVVQQYQRVNFEGIEFSHSHEGFKLVLSEIENQQPGILQPLAEGFESELRQELEHFKMVFRQKLSVVVPSSISESHFA